MQIGVDFTGSTLVAGIVDGASVVRSMASEIAPSSRVKDVMDTLARLVRTLDPRPSALGVCVPGQVDSRGRCQRLLSLPAFEGVPLALEIGTRLGCAVSVDNRTSAAALAERLFGHGVNFPSFLLVTLGDAVGGALVIGQKLYPGANGFGGQIGHFCVDGSERAARCACGRRGCLEVTAGARGVLRAFNERGGPGLRLTQVSTSARRGEAAGLAALGALGADLGRALAGVQNLLDLNAVVLSGPLALVYDLFEARLREEMRAASFASPLAELPICVSELGEAASIVGAAYLPSL